MKYLEKQVNLLHKQIEEQFHERGVMNTRDKVYVDYFALKDLIEYFRQSKEAANIVLRLRDDLDHVYFGWVPEKKNEYWFRTSKEDWVM